jgi:hypothetical protein
LSLEGYKRQLYASPLKWAKKMIALSLIEVFHDRLRQGRLISPDQMIREAAKRWRERLLKVKQTDRDSEPTGFSDDKILAIQLQALQFTYATAAKIYVDHIREQTPATKTALKGRPRTIDHDRELLLRSDLCHLEVAKMLGLDTTTPEQKRKAKDIARKRRRAAKDREGVVER